MLDLTRYCLPAFSEEQRGRDGKARFGSKHTMFGACAMTLTYSPVT